MTLAFVSGKRISLQLTHVSYTNTTLLQAMLQDLKCTNALKAQEEGQFDQRSGGGDVEKDGVGQDWEFEGVATLRG